MSEHEAVKNGGNFALKIDHLVKSYGGGVCAVDDISFSVEKGSLFAFLGVNGAGKSTTINIICSILPKDGGKIYVDGHDLDEDSVEIKRQIGIVFQSSVLDKDLTVRQNLDIRTSFYGLTKEEKKKNITEIIDLLELQPILNQKIRTLSGGQMRRVDIARAMVHKPKLLILDEPTTGLDPKTRLAVWSLINKIRQETGMTVFLTTHYLEEAEKAMEVVIMNKGRIIAQGTPNALKNMYSHDAIWSYGPINSEFESALAKGGESFAYDTDRGAYRITIKNTGDAMRIIGAYDDYISDMEIIKGNMDDVFLSVTGKNITAAEEENGKN